MALYRVWAVMETDCYLDVDADSVEDAMNFAYNSDGGDFITTDGGDWRILPAEYVERLR